jgi:cytochrome P450
MNCFTLDVISLSGFNNKMKNIENGGSELFQQIISVFESVSLAARYPNWIFYFPYFWKFLYTSYKMKNYFKKIVDERVFQEKNNNLKLFDTLSIMLNATEDEYKKFDNEELISNLVLFYSAGFETTSGTI